MREARRPKALVAVVGTTRAWELCWESFAANVLDELGADLALCTGDRDLRPNPLYEWARYIWQAEEPDDWAEVYDRAVGDSSWRALLRPHDQLFGGIRDTEHPQPGMVALLIYMRWLLAARLESSGLLDEYDWLIWTRSDFLWPLPHPDLRLLSPRRIHVFDGEHYGGICCRHVIVPRRLTGRFLRMYDPVFAEPERLADRLDRWRAITRWPVLNLERFQALRLRDLGLWRRVRFLPYVPFTVRAPDGPTGWSRGVFDERLGLYVKYPTERRASEITRQLLPDERSWGRYLAPLRGVVMRRRLTRAYRDQGLYERPFPLGGAPGRIERMGRWDLSRWRVRAIRWTGRILRRVPGLRSLLDARVRRMERRAER